MENINFENEVMEMIAQIKQWQNKLPQKRKDNTLTVNYEDYRIIKEKFLKLLENNYPFHHPLYAGQLLKPPHEISVLGYIAAMLINPNNHANDGGPATSLMEKEVINTFAKGFGFNNYLGHLTTSGTLANLEALWIARECTPNGKALFSSDAHYTHKRVCNLLRMDYQEIPTNHLGQIDIEALEESVSTNDISVIIATTGTTGLGAIDELDKILKIKQKYNVRVHIDGAYGGYYSLIKGYKDTFKNYSLIYEFDSFAFDPHKLGLQPYGCGCIIYKDPEVGKYFKHDSPYTYFTSSDLHLGEISLECSRAGASAAALWLTTQLFEPDSDKGLGVILKKSRDAALKMSELINNSSYYNLYIPPELDIVTYYPIEKTTQTISESCEKIFEYSMKKETNPVYTAKLKVKSGIFQANHPEITVNTPEVTILRSCLIKPEHYEWCETILESLEESYQNCH